MEGSSGEELALPGKLVRLMLSPVPLRSTQDAARTTKVYANRLVSLLRLVTLLLPCRWSQPHTVTSNAFSFGSGCLRRYRCRWRSGGTGHWRLHVCGSMARVSDLRPDSR